MLPSVNVLFTSAGRRVELLQAFRRAYLDLDLKGQIIAVDTNPLAPALQYADRFYLVPPLTDESYIPTLVEICSREHVDLVFPLIDPDIPVLAHHRDALEATGAKVVVVPPNAARIAADKWLTYLFFRSHNIPTPRTWLPSQVKEIEVNYPVIVKPRFGSAGKDVFRANNRHELDFFLEYVPEPLVQEYLSGPEVTSDVICDFTGEVLAVVSRQRIEVRSGEVTKGKTVYEPEIIQLSVAIAKGLGAIGPITVQCFMQEGKPYFTEVNARFGGGVPLGIAAGVKAPHWYLALAAGMALDIPPLGSYQVGLYMSRFDNSVFLKEEEYVRIASHRI